NVARLTQLSVNAGKPGTVVTVSGVGFSEAPDGNQVTLNGKPLAESATVVSASQIRFTFPLAQPDGRPWTLGEVVAVGVISGGQPGANPLPFTVSVPALARITPEQGPVGTVLTISGSSFGAAQGASRVLINGVPHAVAIPATDWNDLEIKITVPQGWAAGPHQIRVHVEGQPPTA